MSSYGTSEEHRPVTWVSGYPLYAAHFIVAIYVGSMLVTTVLDIFHLSAHFTWLPFVSGQVLQGQAWRLATYGLVNPPSLDFVFQMLMIAWFGREVERNFGRATFLWLYAGIYLVTPLLFTLLGLWLPLSKVGVTGSFALFIAFATIYPGALMMFNILAKWAALILVGILSLMALDQHNWIELISLWATCGFAFAFVRHHQGILTLPTIRLWPRRKPNLRVLPDLPATKRIPAPASAGTSMSEVDALLDKIAKSGIRSLTAKERAQLEEARANLLKKEPGRR